MPLTRTKKIARSAAFALALVLGLLLARRFGANPEAQRQQLLRLAPVDSTAVIFVDVDQFRRSPFLEKFYSWAPHPTEDSEYAQFVRDTGFSYERDLKKAVLAISSNQAGTSWIAIADGKFDRKRIEAFLNHNGRSTQEGEWKVFHLNATSRGQPLAVAFLSDERIAVAEGEHLPATLSSSAAAAGYAEWNTHFVRLAGTPLFAVIRRDRAIEDLIDSASPGGFRSPQLSRLVEQLQWISIAGKPEGEQLRVVAEGECFSELVNSQLRDFLQGILMLAQSGLNDPRLRQQMNPEEREAYLEIVKSADIQKIDRGEWKSVRLALEITPRFLDMVRFSSITAPAVGNSAEPDTAKKNPASDKTKAKRKK